MGASNEPEEARRGRGALGLLVVVGVVIAVAVVAALLVVRGTDAVADPGKAEAETFVGAWSAADPARMASVAAAPEPTIAGDLRTATEKLGATRTTYRLTGVTGEGDRRTAAYTAEVELGPGQVWTYQGSFPVAKGETGWKVEWSPAVIHPALTAGARLERARVWAPRAAVLDAAGQPLSGGSTVNVGVRPARVTDKAAVVKAFADALQVDAATVNAALTPKPGAAADNFVNVKTIPLAALDPVKPILEPVKGVYFERVGGQTGSVPTGLAEYVVGRTGVATAEQAAALGAPYQVGDLIGTSGLEQSQERTLAGTPTIEVRVVGADGAVREAVHTIPGTAPQPVRTTIDRNLQRVAEQVLATKGSPAALAVVDRNGGIKALATWAPGAGFNRALAFYAPGSTFKIVTAEAMVMSGLGPDSQLTCPPTINAAGTTIRNSEKGSYPPLPFTKAFAVSCNTAFVGAMQQIPAATLTDAAKRNGFDTPYDIGIPTRAKEGGRFPSDGEGAVRTVNAIGQGKVEATPLHMASVAATALTGQWLAPSFLADRPASLPTVPALDPNVAPALAPMMRAVVADPDATGPKAGAPGKVVSGKTGTAEFGTKNPPDTHAWFVGHDGELSIAVIVEGGGYGGDVAAPLVSQFFSLAG